MKETKSSISSKPPEVFLGISLDKDLVAVKLLNFADLSLTTEALVSQF